MSYTTVEAQQDVSIQREIESAVAAIERAAVIVNSTRPRNNDIEAVLYRTRADLQKIARRLQNVTGFGFIRDSSKPVTYVP